MKFNKHFIRSQNQTKYTKHYGKLIKKIINMKTIFTSVVPSCLSVLGDMLTLNIFYTFFKCLFLVFKTICWWQFFRIPCSFECNRAKCITENVMFSVLQSFNTIKRNTFTNKSVSVFRTACKKPVVDVRSHWTLSGQPLRRTSTQRACTLNVWPFWKFK